MGSGKVRFYNNSKGYGFITPDDNQRKIIVHQSGTTEELKEGDKVIFDIEKNQRGLSAVKVRKI